MLGFAAVGESRADEPPTSTEPMPSGISPDTANTPAAPVPETTPPEPGAVPDLQPRSMQPEAASCPPLSGQRVDRDLEPGKGRRIGGAMMIGLGIATLIPGAVMTAWSVDRDPTLQTSQSELDSILIGGATATAVGAASILAGIPVLVSGVRAGREARREGVVVAPSIQINGTRGATAKIGFRF